MEVADADVTEKRSFSELVLIAELFNMQISFAASPTRIKDE